MKKFKTVFDFIKLSSLLTLMHNKLECLSLVGVIFLRSVPFPLVAPYGTALQGLAPGACTIKALQIPYEVSVFVPANESGLQYKRHSLISKSVHFPQITNPSFL